MAVDHDGALLRTWDLSRRYDEHALYGMVFLSVGQFVGDTAAAVVLVE